MRRARRLLLLATLLAIAPVLAGCADFDFDKLDVFHLNDKKKLPGERRELFPGGVPGVSQGVPQEYMKGYQPQPEQSAETLPPGAKVNPGDEDAAAVAKPPSKTAAVEPSEAAKPKPKQKPKPKTTAGQRTPTQITIQPASPAQSPWPATPGQAQQQQSPWPAASGQAQQQQQQQPAQQSPWTDPKAAKDNTAWPAPPPSGTFSQ